MAKGTKEVGLGIEVVDHAGKSFEMIQQSINEVAAQIQEVTAYSQQIQSSTGQAVEIVVITSYSIHYTKLYDWSENFGYYNGY